MFAAFFDVPCQTVTPPGAQPACGFWLQAVVQPLGVDGLPARMGMNVLTLIMELYWLLILIFYLIKDGFRLRTMGVY